MKMRAIILLSILGISFYLGWAIRGELSKYGTRISDNITMSTTEALIFLDDVIYPHQYYLDRPELQTDRTGDSNQQIGIINQYNRLKGLIKALEAK